jgi:protoporphyrin/coproporphyrin ferrochelatase
VLLVNVGTPDAPTPRAVRRYLEEFLSDPFVIDIPAPLRFLLLHLWILPLRPRRAAAAYRKIWTERGSPLRVHGEDLRAKLSGRTGRSVALGMRYGQPGLGTALDELVDAGVKEVQVLPLFPQYSESAWETAAVATRRLAKDRGVELSFVPPFFDHPGFLAALAAVARPTIAEFAPDHLLVSFHGLPERHIRRTDRSETGFCLTRADCCDEVVSPNRDCYRAQCFATARGLAAALELDPARWSVAFQSRLGRTPWIRPFTDHRVTELAATGCKRLAVTCPSFVTDCLETLEEIQIRARDMFVSAGGEDLRLIPAVNSSDTWVEVIAGLLDE